MTASWLLLLSFALIFVDAENVEDSDTKRFTVENPFMQNKFYAPFISLPTNENSIPSNVPVFAKIIPINTQNQQIGSSVTGYVYASEVPPYFLPNFIMPCKKETTASATSEENLEPKILELMTNLEKLAKKVQTLAELFALQNKIQTIGAYEGETLQNTESSATDTTVSTKRQESESTTPETEEIEETSTLREDGSTTQANVNTQSDVFQCEGFTCPKTTVSCKVAERSVEPTHEKIVKTVFCFNQLGNTIKQVEKKVANPKKGSSLNTSRTHDNNSNSENPKEKEVFESDMKKFQLQMNSAFGQF